MMKSAANRQKTSVLLAAIILTAVSIVRPVFSQTPLKIDFTQTGGPVYAGWEGYFANHEVLSSFVTQSYSAFGTTIDITPTWAAGAVNATSQMYDRGTGVWTDANDFLRDWIGTDARTDGDPMTLTIEGLPAGAYAWKSYHHDTLDQTGLFDVTINDAVSSFTITDIDISSTQYDDVNHLADVTTFDTNIISNGTNPISLVFHCQNSSGPVSGVFFLMNGFELDEGDVDPNKALRPSPANGTGDISISVNLSWAGPFGYTPSSYDVYLGTDSNAHNNPKHTVYTNSYDPPGELSFGTTYHWAVDSNNNGMIYPGDDWSFTTMVPVEVGDYVAGNMMLINDNAGWCWYQDEKIIYDPVDGSIITSTSGQGSGFDDGSGRGNDVDATTFNIATGKRTRVKACDRGGDDHNMGALWIRPDGRYLHIYTGHNADDNSYYRTTIYPNDGSSWSDELYYNWVDISGLPDDTNITYSNVLYLSAEGRLYNITRGFGRNPQISYSDDSGVTWHYGGRLTVPSGSSSYSNGYYKFNSNGVDRIDFITTEHHPRNYNNSIYHGYIKGGKSYNSYGEVVDDNIFDQNSPTPEDFTQVFAAGPQVPGSLHTAWTAELELDSQGHPVCLFTTRYGTDPWGDGSGQATIGAADHRIFYARFNGETWNYKQLSKMGTGLHRLEQDYTGIGCIHPNDVNVIYISTNFDPRTDVNVGRHEIFKGVTNDNGANWAWTQITIDSTVDNLRPAIPKWSANNTAVFWPRGYYPYLISGGAPQGNYDEVLVGMIDRENETLGLVNYIDASVSNTTNADGNAFSPTGPSSSAGTADNLWHECTRYGNGGSCFTAGDGGTENAPAIKTAISGLADGTYDVFAYFWSDPEADWGIRGGFASDANMMNFNKQSSQHAEAAQFSGAVEVVADEAILYRVYIGRKEVSGGASIDVYIDDYDSSFTNRPTRTTYDGVGVALVIPEDGDLNCDGKVNLKDIAVLGQGWLTIYGMDTLADIAGNWLSGT